METEHKLPPDGTIVRAKRLGWDEVLTPEQEDDMETYAEKGYESDDLEGPITTYHQGEFSGVLVGVNGADPKTVRVVED